MGAHVPHAPAFQMAVGSQNAESTPPLYILQISTTADLCMENLVDKLKLLDYEKEFCKKK